MKNVVAIIVIVIVVVVIIAFVRRDDGKPQQTDVAVPEQSAPAEPKEAPKTEVADTPDTKPETVAEKAPEVEPVQVTGLSIDPQTIMGGIPLYDNSEVISSTFQNGKATRVFKLDTVVASGLESYESTVTEVVDFYKSALEDDGWEIPEVHVMRDLHNMGSINQQPISAYLNKRHFEATKGGKTINFTIDQSVDAADIEEIKILAMGYINVE